MKLNLLIFLGILISFILIRLETEEEIQESKKTKYKLTQKDYEAYQRYEKNKEKDYYEKELIRKYYIETKLEYKKEIKREEKNESEGFICNSKTNRPVMVVYTDYESQKKPHDISSDYADGYLAYNQREAKHEGRIYSLRDGRELSF